MSLIFKERLTLSYIGDLDNFIHLDKSNYVHTRIIIS